MKTDDPQGRPAPHGVTTTDALRVGIDHGRGSDKVDFPDPAASPLGTDDEAAGTPPLPADVADAASHELSRTSASPNDSGERVPMWLREGRGIPVWAWLLSVLLILGALVFALLPLD